MASLDGQCICNKLMMQTLENCIYIIFFLIFDQADAIEWIEAPRIEFVKWQPVVYTVSQPFKQCCGIGYKEINGFAVFPPAIFQQQISRIL